jgi:hypothetical protein
MAKGVLWANFYWGSLGLSGINLFALGLSFRPTNLEVSNDRRNAIESNDCSYELESNSSDEEKMDSPISSNSSIRNARRDPPSLARPLVTKKNSQYFDWYD